MGIATSSGFERAWALARLSLRSVLWLAAPECRMKDAGRSQTAGTGVQFPMVLTSLWTQLLVAGTVHSERPLFQSGFLMNTSPHCCAPGAPLLVRRGSRRRLSAVPLCYSARSGMRTSGFGMQSRSRHLVTMDSKKEPTLKPDWVASPKPK